MKPIYINVHRKSATLELVYKNGITHRLSAEYLRVFSPSAEVQGHSPGQAVLQFGKRNVTFKDIEPQGHYAIRISFSDGHDSGIYSWNYLFELASSQETKWHEYLEALEATNKSRNPQFIAVDQLKG